MAEHQLVVIVGAGLSGLCAARLLHNQGIPVIVLEANSRAGGRLFTKRSPDVGYVDVGGSYVGPTQNRVFRLAKEMGIETYPVYHKAPDVYYSKGTSYRVKSYDSPPGNIIANMDVNNIFREIDALLETVPADRPWDAPDASNLDRLTAQEWFNKKAWTDVAMRKAQLLCTDNIVSEPCSLSLLFMLWYVKQAGGTARINATEGGAQERKFVGGSQQLCEKIAIELADHVVYNSPVSLVEQDEQGVRVETLDGKRYQGSYLILALAPTLQQRIHFRPPLPAKRAQLLQRMPMGSVIKTICYYEAPYWRQKGVSGTMVILDDDLDLPVSSTLDDCKPDGSYPAIMGFIQAGKAQTLSALSPEQRKVMIAKQYAKILDCPEMAKPVHYEEMDWCSAPWSGGCYTSVMGPGVLTNLGSALREPVGRMFMAGTETATEWTGYMEGAIQAGERAAREVLFNMGQINHEDINMPEPASEEHSVPDLSRSFLETVAPSPSTLAYLAAITGVVAVAGAIIAKL